MALESWVLDTVPLTSGTFVMMSLNAAPPKAKPQWISGADSEWSALLAEPNYENRTFTMQLRVPAAASMDAALDAIASIRDKLRLASRSKDGVQLLWTPNNSTRTRAFDVLHGEVTELPIGNDGIDRQWFIAHPVFTIELTAKPYWYDTAETLSSTASGSLPVLTLDVAGVGGDVPALGRLIVTDTATQARRDVEWGIQNRDLNGALSYIIDSDSLVTSGFAGTQTTRSGSYDPNATGNNVIRAATILTTPLAVCGTGAQSHVGTFRVWGRFFVANASQRVRLSWRAGDNPYTGNLWASVPTIGWVEVDLGTITIPTTITGTQVWDGRVEAYESDSTVTPGALDVDFVRLTPAGEGYGRARAAYSYVPGVTSAYDEFATITPGAALNLRAAPLGGSWATSGGTTDFVGVDLGASTGGLAIERTPTNDSTGYRYAILGSTNYTDTTVQFRHGLTVTPAMVSGSISQACVARYTDSTHWLVLEYQRSPTGALLFLETNNGGTIKVLAQMNVPLVWTGGILRVIVYASGVAIGQMVDITGSAIQQQVYGYSVDLKTGGALATGKPGIRDFANYVNGNAAYRVYDGFTVMTPAPEPIVLNSGRSMQFRNDGVFRYDSTGAIPGNAPSYRGDDFLVPPGTTRVAVAARRVDLNEHAADDVTDAMTVQVGYRERGLVVPRD